MPVICRICGFEGKAITHRHLKKHNTTVDEYQKLYVDAEMYSQEYRDILSSKLKGTKLGDNNPSKRDDVRKQIAATVKERWNEGLYKNRINGMLGKIGKLNPQYKKERWEESLNFCQEQYRTFLEQFEDTSICNICGNPATNIHHIDENLSNFLPSNLEPLCVPCHGLMHHELSKRPFTIIGKELTFAAAHFLPNYIGPCSKIHGHEWRVEVAVRKRINPRTGMVMDFSLLKKIMQENIIQKFDHDLVNNILLNPTAENLLEYMWIVLMFQGHLKGIHHVKIWESPTSWAMLDIRGMLSLFYSNIEKFVTKEDIAEIIKSKCEKRGTQNEK